MAISWNAVRQPAGQSTMPTDTLSLEAPTLCRIPASKTGSSAAAPQCCSPSLWVLPALCTALPPPTLSASSRAVALAYESASCCCLRRPPTTTLRPDAMLAALPALLSGPDVIAARLTLCAPLPPRAKRLRCPCSGAGAAALRPGSRCASRATSLARLLALPRRAVLCMNSWASAACTAWSLVVGRPGTWRSATMFFGASADRRVLLISR